MKPAIALLLFLLLGCTQKTQPLQETALVLKAIDGDTVELASMERIRLIGINANEKGENCYAEAKEKLEELVKGKKVKLERDKTNQDKYGRLLRYLYVNGEMVNLEMVREGQAYAFPYEPDTKFREEFEQAERNAEENSAGCLWKK